MKCVSYDYDFESDLVTKWKALDRATPQQSGGTKHPGTRRKYRRRQKKKQDPTSDDSEDEGGALTGTSRDHLPRKARQEKHVPDYADLGVSDSEGLSEEEEDDLYHDANGGDLSDHQ